MTDPRLRALICYYSPPSLMPQCFSIVARISSAPFTMQGVVPQSWMNHFPTFSLHVRNERVWSV